APGYSPPTAVRPHSSTARPTTSPTSASPGTCRPPAATAWQRCSPSSAIPPSAPRDDLLVAVGGRGARLAAAQPGIPGADGVPDLHDPVLPDRRGHRWLARLRDHAQPVRPRPDRPGRGAALLLH